jgi:hypothetical protein
MSKRRAGMILLVVQLLIVLSIAGKFLYERRFYPRVWTRARQVDPNLPLRGRYLALQIMIDACSLPKDAQYYRPGGRPDIGSLTSGWSWFVVPAPVNGRLAARLANPKSENDQAQYIFLEEHLPCTLTPFSSGQLYFIPDTSSPPFPLKPGQELWVEVTLPPSGPPRPIQLAISDPSGFHPLKFE